MGSMGSMGRFLRLGMLLGAICAGCAWAQAEEPAGGLNAKHIKELIARLNAPDTIDREEAEKELLTIGQPALQPLRDASGDPQPEIAARARKLVARLVQVQGKPLSTYAELFPANSVFFVESPDSKGALDRLTASPLGKFWNLAETQKFYKSHYDSQLDNDRKLLDCISSMFKLADGRALLAFGPPETAEASELDPPLIYALDSKDGRELELQVRALLEAMNDPPRSLRRYGPFSIEEQTSAQTVFSQEGMIHSLTQAGIEAFLDNFTRKPADPLTPELAEIRKLLPDYDLLVHVKHTGFDTLAEAGQLVDDDIIRTLNTLGFAEGSEFQSALGVNADGFAERGRIVFNPKIKNEGLLAVVKAMSVTPPGANAPQALDLIPWQAGILLSFQGDIAKDSAALARSLRALDAAGAVENLDVKPKPPDAKDGKKDDKKTGAANRNVLDPKQPDPKPPEPKLTDKPKTPGEEALAAGGGLGDTKPNGEAPPKVGDAPKEEEHKTVYPRIQRFERIGLKLEQFLEQIDGPVQLAVFLNTIGDEMPESVPLTPLYAVLLKDPRAVEQALDAQAAGDKPRYAKELLNGGAHYVEIDGGETRPGYWLKGNYLAYSTEREVLDLASKALLHANGNERMSDRPSYQQELAAKRYDPQAVLSIFGDADQILETPYKLACMAWKPDAPTAYPDYKVVKPLLLNKPVSIQFKTVQDAIQFTAQTPLSLLGMIEAFRLPIKEAGL